MALSLSYVLRPDLIVAVTLLVCTPKVALSSIVLTADSAACGTSSPGGAFGRVSTSPLPEGNGVQGIQINGNCTALFSTFDVGSGAQPQVDFDLSPQDLFTLISGSSGGADTFLSDSIHVAWNFNPTSDMFAIINWTVWVEINGLPQIFSGSTDPGLDVTGEADISVPQGATLVNWTTGIGIQQDGIANSDSFLSLFIPQHSLDIGVSQIPPTVPEPSTLLMLSIAFAVIWPAKRLLKFLARP